MLVWKSIRRQRGKPHKKISLRQRECRRLTLQSSRLSREGNGGGKGRETLLLLIAGALILAVLAIVVSTLFRDIAAVAMAPAHPLRS